MTSSALHGDGRLRMGVQVFVELLQDASCILKDVSGDDRNDDSSFAKCIGVHIRDGREEGKGNLQRVHLSLDKYR